MADRPDLALIVGGTRPDMFSSNCTPKPYLMPELAGSNGPRRHYSSRRTVGELCVRQCHWTRGRADALDRWRSPSEPWRPGFVAFAAVFGRLTGANLFDKVNPPLIRDSHANTRYASAMIRQRIS